MNPNPALGVFFHWLGGLASASFYVPYRGVKNWAWETYWLVGGFFSWIIAPWILALAMTHDLSRVLHEAPMSNLLWTGRPHLWPDHALSGDVAGHGRCARIHSRIRHIDASNLPWRVSNSGAGHSIRDHNSWGRRSLSSRHRVRGSGRSIQGARDVE